MAEVVFVGVNRDFVPHAAAHGPRCWRARLELFQMNEKARREAPEAGG
jgi:hypothetical protein